MFRTNCLARPARFGVFAAAPRAQPPVALLHQAFQEIEGGRMTLSERIQIQEAQGQGSPGREGCVPSLPHRTPPAASWSVHEHDGATSRPSGDLSAEAGGRAPVEAGSPGAA
eukprot:scaffold736_cov254-Pinguiococcus_pyrenoidosus.AAC.42